MEKQTQKEKVLKHLLMHNYITTWDAFTKYNITRLAARISDLKDDGYVITSERISVKDDKKIERTHYNKYTLVR